MTLLDGDPRSVGGYRLEDRLGAGGMGVVFLGRSVSGRLLAIKVIRPELVTDDAFRVRFRQEVAAARQVSGAFTAPVVDADTDAEQPWLATLFVPGPSLHQRVAEQGPLPEGQVRGLAAGLVEALRDIHRAGLIHRDLKPGNVLLAEDGPRVIDFGIARATAAAPLTRTGVVVGTPAFMAPEQFRTGAVGPAGDVFALGSVLVYAATGHAPFDGESSHGIGFRVVYEEPDLTGLPEGLRPLVESCLSKDPDARPTVDELLASLSSEPKNRSAASAAPHPDPATRNLHRAAPLGSSGRWSANRRGRPGRYHAASGPCWSRLPYWSSPRSPSPCRCWPTGPVRARAPPPEAAPPGVRPPPLGARPPPPPTSPAPVRPAPSRAAGPAR